VNGCSSTPKTCTPLWTGATGGDIVSSRAVANGVVYIGSVDDFLSAFDANGVTGCSGTPTTCSPLWKGSQCVVTPIEGPPTVENGVVYIGNMNGEELEAFDAAGSINCSGSPKVWTTLWHTGQLGGVVFSNPVVVGGRVYVGSGSGAILAFGLP
jgi:outer membrane protein assembly factor BamB